MSRLMTASIKAYDSDMPDVVLSQHIWVPERVTLARHCANEIAGTRNIAALWDIVRVRVDGVDITADVKDAYDRLYVSRRPEFLQWVS